MGGYGREMSVVNSFSSSFHLAPAPYEAGVFRKYMCLITSRRQYDFITLFPRPGFCC